MAEFDIPRSTEAVKAVRSPEFQVAIQKLENEMHLSVEIYCPSTANEELLITIIHRSDDNMAFEKAKTAVLKIFEDLQVCFLPFKIKKILLIPQKGQHKTTRHKTHPNWFVCEH